MGGEVGGEGGGWERGGRGEGLLFEVGETGVGEGGGEWEGGEDGGG